MRGLAGLSGDDVSDSEGPNSISLEGVSTWKGLWIVVRELTVTKARKIGEILERRLY